MLRRWAGAPWLLRAALPIAIMASIWWASGRTPESIEPLRIPSLIHNAMHVAVFGLLAAALWLALARVHRREDRTAWIGAVVTAIAYGVVDELHQSLVPGRECSLADIGSDAFGAAIAVALVRHRFGFHSPRFVVPMLGVLAGACVAGATWGGCST